MAICSSVAVARADTVSGPAQVALTEGYRAGFIAAVGFAVLGLVVAWTMFGRVRASVPAHASQPSVRSAQD